MADATTTEPFPIFQVGGRYLLFDVDAAMYARRVHHICGVLIGNIPMANQQNIFSGMPLELLPEEARLLVERGHAFVVDDVKNHSKQLHDLSDEERQAYLEQLEAEGLEAATAALKVAEEGKARGLAREAKRKKNKAAKAGVNSAEDAAGTEELLFAGSERSSTPAMSSSKAVEAKFLSPTTSYPPLKAVPTDADATLPAVPSSYGLYAYLHDQGYWMTPGLRFGCQYSVYPGDPLRFHSHFLATSHEWEEEFDLLDIVGGGRLGTGVKKGYVIGGVKKQADGTSDETNAQEVRAFSIEWAAM